MPPSKKLYLFRKLVKNAKWWSKSILPLSHSPDRKIFPFKKGFKKPYLGLEMGGSIGRGGIGRGGIGRGGIGTTVSVLNLCKKDLQN